MIVAPINAQGDMEKPANSDDRHEFEGASPRAPVAAPLVPTFARVAFTDVVACGPGVATRARGGGRGGRPVRDFYL